jgi:hypothetical protein
MCDKADLPVYCLMCDALSYEPGVVLVCVPVATAVTHWDSVGWPVHEKATLIHSAEISVSTL